MLLISVVCILPLSLHGGEREKTFGRLYQEGHYWPKSSILKAIEEAPKNAIHHFRLAGHYGDLLGYSDFRRNRAQELRSISEGIACDPHAHPGAYRRRARLYSDTQQWKEALADCTKCIELTMVDDLNDEPRGRNAVYVLRAYVYLRLQEYALALKDLDFYIEKEESGDVQFYLMTGETISPEACRYAYLLRGHAYRYLKEYDKAIADYSLVIERPKRPYEDFLRFHFAAERDFYKYRHGIPSDKSIRLDCEEAYRSRGLVYQFLHHPDLAERDFEAAKHPVVLDAAAADYLKEATR